MSQVMKLLGMCLVAAFALPAHADDQAARDLVKGALDSLPRAGFKATLKLTTDQGERTLEMQHKIVGGARSTYLEVVAPPDLQGIRFLFLEKVGASPEQYMKVAAARTSVRVAGEVRRQPFLGSPFYIADLVEPDLDAFTYAFTGEDQVHDRKCKLVEAVPKKADEAVYGKVVMCIDPTDKLVLRRQFFDHKDKVQKVWTVDKVEKVEGFWTIRDQRMANVQDNSTGRLEVPSVTYNVFIDDAVFTPKYLLR